MLPEIDARVRLAVYTAFVDGVIPLSATIASKLHLPPDQVRDSYERLHTARAIVLDPHTREVWMAPPFSAKPTAFRVLAEDRTWSAPCAWDAFGITNLLDCDAVLTTTCPGLRRADRASRRGAEAGRRAWRRALPRPRSEVVAQHRFYVRDDPVLPC